MRSRKELSFNVVLNSLWRRLIRSPQHPNPPMCGILNCCFIAVQIVDNKGTSFVVLTRDFTAEEKWAFMNN